MQNLLKNSKKYCKNIVSIASSHIQLIFVRRRVCGAGGKIKKLLLTVKSEEYKYILYSR